MGKRKHNHEDDDESHNYKQLKKHCSRIELDGKDDQDITTNDDINWSQLDSYVNPVDYADELQSSTTCLYPALWVAPTHLKNYFLNDPVLDWFKINDSKISKNTTKSTKSTKSTTKYLSSWNPIFIQGNTFEAKIWNYLSSNYPDDSVQISPSAYEITDEHIARTIEHITAGTPIIYQAPLEDNTSKLRGSCDLIIRSDWFDRLFEVSPISANECTASSAIHNGFHYRIIDIKWMHLKLKVDGCTPLAHPLMPVYRAQLAIYNFLLGKIQGYTPPASYILGKTTSFNNNCKFISSNNSWERLGVVQFDNDFLGEVVKAIQWNRSVKTFGTTWDIKPFDGISNIKHLYPNMCNKYDAPYSQRKKQLAQQIGEITQIWNVGITQRRFAHSNGIFHWRDPQCNSASLGIKSAKTATLVDKILDVNRGASNENIFFSEEITSNQTTTITNIISSTSTINRKRKSTTQNSQSSTISNPTYTSQKIKRRRIDKSQNSSEPTSYFLDFETVQTCFFDDENPNSNLVFMIGLGHANHNSTWNFKNWHITTNDKDTELGMVIEMLEYVCKSPHPVIYHWSPAEISILRRINADNNSILDPYLNRIRFVDLYKTFLQKQIVIPGALSFGLKDVATAMHSNNMISTKWLANESNITSGIDALFGAVALFDTSSTNKHNLNDKNKKQLLADIAKYNEIDCKVLMEINIWLAANHYI